MNYTESFEEFSRRVTPTDLMIYAGAAIVLFVLFKDQLVPAKQWALKWYNGLLSKTKKESTSVVLPVSSVVTTTESDNDADFLHLISSWKNTRDLADKMSCSEAVKILDSAFSHLGPNNCVDKTGDNK